MYLQNYEFGDMAFQGFDTEFVGLDLLIDIDVLIIAHLVAEVLSKPQTLPKDPKL